MDKQQEQTKQNPNQEVEYISGFLEEEEVNELAFDEPTGQQEVGKLADNQQKKPNGEEQSKKVKRPRKTIEQEIAELDAKRDRLMEKKRRQEAHAKIVFGGAVIALLKNLRENKDPLAMDIVDKILNFTNKNNPKDIPILLTITDKIRDMKIK